MKITKEFKTRPIFVLLFACSIAVFVALRHYNTEASLEARTEATDKIVKMIHEGKKIKHYQLAETIRMLQPKIDETYSSYIAYRIIEDSYPYNVCPMLVTAIMYAESAFDQMALSDKGAIGLMQINFNAWKGKEEIGKAVNPMKLYQIRLNIKSGIRILQYYLKKKGTTRKALEGYLGEKSDAYYTKVMQTTGEISIKLFNINSRGGGGGIK